MGARIEETHGLMLAMHLQQGVSQFAQNANASRLIVHERATATIRRDRPAQDQILIARVSQALVLEDRPDRMVDGRREDRRSHRLNGASAYEPRLAARAGGQA